MDLLMNTPKEVYWMLIGAIVIGLIAGLFQRFTRSITRKKPKSKKASPKSHAEKIKNFDKIYNKITIAKVDKMTGEEFEILTEKLIRVVYQDQVIKTEQTTRTGDQGCDLVVHLQNGKRLGIQCKRYEGKVSSRAVQNIVGSKPFYGLDILMVVTNSYFTPGGLEAIAKHKAIKVDRDELQKWIDSYNQSLEKLHSKK